MNTNDTLQWKLERDRSQEIRQILTEVYKALEVKGYDPISQIVGYIMSGDPTYITSHDGARGKIVRVDRDILLEEFVKAYVAQL